MCKSEGFNTEKGKMNLSCIKNSTNLKVMIFSLYIWLPLAYSIVTYTLNTSRHSWVVALAYILLFTICSAVYLIELKPAKSTDLDWLFVLFITYILYICIFNNSWPIKLLSIFPYVLLPYFIGRFLVIINHIKLSTVNYNVWVIVAIIVLIINYFINDNINPRTYVFGSYSNSVPLSLTTAFVACLLILISQSQPNKNNINILRSCVFGILSGLISPRWLFVAQIFLCFIYIFIKAGERKVIFAVTISMGVVIFFNKITLNLYSEIIRPLSYKESGSAIKERLDLWSSGAKMFEQNLLIGVGPGNFGSAAGISSNSFPHFSGLQVFSELGLIGGVIYLFMHVITGYRLLKYIKVDCVHSMMFAFYIYGLIFSIFHGDYLTDKFTYLAVGYASLLSSEHKK